MGWLLWAGASALFLSFYDLLGKKILRKQDEYFVTWAGFFFIGLGMIPLWFWLPIPELNETFWLALVGNGSLNLVIVLLYVKAIKEGELSLTLPMTTMTPLFLIAVGPLLTGEWVSATGMAGIALMIAGAYVLGSKTGQRGLLAPFRALISNRGPRLMLTVAFLWAITASLDKIGISQVGPWFWLLSVVTFLSVMLAIPVALWAKEGFAPLRRPLPFMALGLFQGLSLIATFMALTTGLVAYAIAIKRTSALFSSVWGVLFFGERGGVRRLGGAALMVLGVFVIAGA